MPQINDHTPLPWEGKPHLMDDTTSCNCKTWCEQGYAGGILSVEVNNGISSISEGGNDAPPLEEAKANAIFVDTAIHSFYPMRDALRAASGRCAPEVQIIIDRALKCAETSGYSSGEDNGK